MACPVNCCSTNAWDASCVLHAPASPLQRGGGRLDSRGASLSLPHPSLRNAYALPDPQQRPPRSALRTWIAASSLLGAVVIGVGAGLWLDRRFGTAPLWLAVCGLGSVALAMVHLIREARR